MKLACVIPEQIKPVIVAVAGPPGVGKTSTVNGVLMSCTVAFRPRSITTRPPRPGEERSGQFDHLTLEDYLRVATSGDLLASYPTFGKHRYGVTRTALDCVPTGMIPILELDPRNIRQLKKHRRLTSVLVISQNARQMLARLQSRGSPSDNQSLEERWQGGIDLLEFGEPMDHIIINKRLGQAISELRTIVESEWLASQRYSRAAIAQSVLADMKTLDISELQLTALTYSLLKGF